MTRPRPQRHLPPKKQTAQSKAAVEIGYDRINTHIAQAVNNAVAQTTQAMLLPCLELVQPFIDYALACGGLNGLKETQANTVGTTVHDAVKKLKKDWEEAVKSSTEIDDEDGFDTSAPSSA